MALLHANRILANLQLQEVQKPELYREAFPYAKISRVEFDDIHVMPRAADPMCITDTTFRDGQQARPPYSIKQSVHIFDLLHRLGGRSGLIRASEFFMYSEKDRKTIEACRKLGYKFPHVTGWIRAHIGDLKIAKDMEFDEVGMLTSVSDYHIFLKLGWDRQKAFDTYIKIATQALEWGIVPRCHFEDITRADIFGFCLPLASKLMELSKEAGMPVKIRLCDTMGYGVPYAGASLPRSVPRIVRAFTDVAGVPGEWLEWHGHNDFHKVLVNGVTAWLHGCSSVNSTLLGFGERTGNTPLEALVIEYISLTGDDDAADTRVITEIARYFSSELDYRIPDNYPFAGKDFNATSAGIHVDGLAKNEEIYNIFDTRKILDRPVPIIITDKSGRAGVAYWINQELSLLDEQQITKSHPAVGQIYERVMAEYERERTTSYSNKEMLALVQRFLPELFPSDFTKMKTLARELAASLIDGLAETCVVKGAGIEQYPWLLEFLKEYSFTQYGVLTDAQGRLLAFANTDPLYKERYDRLPLGYDYSSREWFMKPMSTGKLHVTDVYQSHFTDRLILTVSAPVTNAADDITGVIAFDIQLEPLLQRAEQIENRQKNDELHDSL